MTGQPKIIIKRGELYERVWQIPAVRLATEYKMSDSRLGIICKRLKVPKPSPGYWMKIEHGKKVRRPSLPSLGPSEQTEYEHYVFEGRQSPIVNDPDMESLLDNVPTIRVAQRLYDPDPLIRNTQISLSAKADYLAEPIKLQRLTFDVYPDSVARALRLLDSLIKGFKNLGCQVKGIDASSKEQYIEILGQRVSFRLKEKSKRIDHALTKEEVAKKKEGRQFFVHAWDYLPTGNLALSIDAWGAMGYRKKWSDSARKPLEGQLRDFIMGAISIAHALKKEGERRLKAEQVAAEQRIKRIEEEKRHAEEEARFRELDNKVARWIKGKQLKAYINEYKSRFVEGLFSDQVTIEFNRWLLWANDYADRLDPISTSLAKMSGSSQKDK